MGKTLAGGTQWHLPWGIAVDRRHYFEAKQEGMALIVIGKSCLLLRTIVADGLIW